MSAAPQTSTLLRELIAEPNEKPFARIWAGFLTTRVLIGLVLVATIGAQMLLQERTDRRLDLAIAVAYFVAALAARISLKQSPVLRQFSLVWAIVIGIDMLAFAVLHLMQYGAISYIPLLILPVLEAAVLGSFALAMGTTALAAIVMLIDAWMLSFEGTASAHYMQAGVYGMGFFVLAILVAQVATRLEREEVATRSVKRLARTQAEINALMLQAMQDGVLVVNHHGHVLNTNPAAQLLLDLPADGSVAPAQLVLQDSPNGKRLLPFIEKTFRLQRKQEMELELPIPIPAAHSDTTTPAMQRLLVRTQLAGDEVQIPEAEESAQLCLVFLQDLREVQARVRTEKLAAMGRMSAAVAHEIRNPLSAITQANALLAEDATSSTQKRLNKMISDNARRLGKIVDEILDVARIQEQGADSSTILPLNALVQRITKEWQTQHQLGGELLVAATNAQLNVWFDADHMRRILVNLLDNALRYANLAAHPIVVRMRNVDENWHELSVWSNGTPIEAGVQKHLFEPFFSSESRSSGLGLYICRQLCERHGATINYRQSTLSGIAGNEFVLLLRAEWNHAVANEFEPTIF